MEHYEPPKKVKKCCVPNCTNKGVRHRFPRSNPVIFQKWLDIIKSLNYETLSMDQQYNRYYVCNNHFSDDCFVVGIQRGLKRKALPTLNIPGMCLVELLYFMLPVHQLT